MNKNMILLLILFILLVLIICFIINLQLYNTKLYNNKIYGDSNINKIYGGRNINKITYTISGSGNFLDYSILRKLLIDAKNHYGFAFEEHPIKEKVHISFGDYTIDNNNHYQYDSGFFTQQSAIKNMLNRHNCFISKIELYKTIRRLIPLGVKHIPTTYLIKEFEDILSKNISKDILSKNMKISYPLILKKLNVSRQKGVKLIMSKDDYYKAKKELGIKYDGAISEYITNSLTVDGKKFHLRVHFLLSVINGITRCIAHDELHIVTAKEKYKQDDWLNPNIHLSGGQYTEKRYTYPDDVDIGDKELLTKNVNLCIEVTCMALSMSNVTNFEETNVGYYIYGADIMIDSNANAYILEINRRPGFGPYGFGFREKKEAEAFTERFSHSIFSFILHTTIFPYFGICNESISYIHAEFINNGILSPFGNILTGKHKCCLIPYNSATESEIEKAKHFQFYKAIHFNHIIKTCDRIHIFLIGIHNTKTHKTIIGYIGLQNKEENKLYLQIAIIEEYQNRGIATAMIAQLLEVYYARQFINSHSEIIVIHPDNNILNNIAKKLHFTKHKTAYERKIKDKKLYNDHKINRHQLIYHIINNTNYNNDNTPFHKILQHKMILSTSHIQFIHFVYTEFSDLESHIQLKRSTGSKYNKLFIHQGAELKSTLHIKPLYKIEVFKKWIQSEEIDATSLFLSQEDPFLKNDKLITLRCYLMVYISNGIIKCFVFDKKIITIGEKKYDPFVLNENTHYTSTDKVYNWPNDFKSGKLADIAGDCNIINSFIKNFFNILLKSDIKKYEESNAGFLNFAIDIKFCSKNMKYIPILQSVYNTSGVYKNNIIDESFIKQYHEWIINSVVYPHFGIHSKPIAPLYIDISSKLKKETIYQNIDILIISKLNIIINDKDKNFNIEILYNNTIWQKIYLKKIDDLTIELDMSQFSSQDNKIVLNAIFILMDTIAAYFSPIQMSLLLIGEDLITHEITHKLQFFRQNNAFIRKCRI